MPVTHINTPEGSTSWEAFSGPAPATGTLSIDAISAAALYIRVGTPPNEVGWKVKAGPGGTPLPLLIPVVQGQDCVVLSTGDTTVTWHFI